MKSDTIGLLLIKSYIGGWPGYMEAPSYEEL